MPFFIATLAVILSIASVLAQGRQQVEVTASFAKASPRTEPNARVFLGPQEGLHMIWVIGNQGAEAVVVPAPIDILRTGMTTGSGQQVAIENAWEPVVRKGGAVPQNEAVILFSVVRREDGQPFEPGEYRLTLDISRLGPALEATGWRGQAMGGGTLRIVIDPLDSLAATLERHQIEAAFNMNHNPQLALEHRLAAAALPGADLGDLMALGKAWAELGRHSAAVAMWLQATSLLRASYLMPKGLSPLLG